MQLTSEVHSGRSALVYKAKRILSVGETGSFASLALFCLATALIGDARAAQDVPVPSSSGVSAQELQRAQAFVDARYKASDVKYSFRTRFGDTVDCIDFFAQAGVREMERRGAPIKTLPTLKEVMPKTGAVFDGSLDDDGNKRQCPANMVARVRLTAGQITRAGGLDTYLSRIKKFSLRGVNQTTVAPPEPGFLGYAHTYLTYIGKESLTQSQTSLSIWNPPVPASPLGNHSLEQVWWAHEGTNFVSGLPPVPCAPTCQQTVEAGWTVDPSLYQDERTHLFIYSTADGYQNGCYNASIPVPLSSACLPWIAFPSAYPPGLTLPASAPGSVPTFEELQAWIGSCSVFNECPAGWEVRIRAGGVGGSGTVGIGYYPAADFSGPFQTGANKFKAGGEVFDKIAQASSDLTWANPLIPMGSGRAATAGLGNSAYVGVIEAKGPSGGTALSDYDSGMSTVPSKYAVWQNPDPGNLESDIGVGIYLGLTPPAPAPLPAPPPSCASPGNPSPGDQFAVSGNEVPVQVAAGGVINAVNLVLSGSWVAKDGGANAAGQIVSSNLPAGSVYYTSLGASESQSSYGLMQLSIIVPGSTIPGPYSLSVQPMDNASCVRTTAVVPLQVLACVPQNTCPRGGAQVCGFVSNGCGGQVNCGSCGAGQTCSDSVCCPSGSFYNAFDGACEPTSCPTGTTFCPDLGGCTTDAKCNKGNCHKVNGILECQ